VPSLILVPQIGQDGIASPPRHSQCLAPQIRWPGYSSNTVYILILLYHFLDQ